MKYRYLFALLLISALANAQRIVITGTVRTIDGKPLPGASILAPDSTGTIANESGVYRLEVQKMPGYLSARNLGFFPRRYKIKREERSASALTIDFDLTPNDYTLPETQISAKKIESIAEETYTSHFYDFGFVGDNLLVLVREKRKYYIRLITESGQMLSQLRLNYEPDILHQSCLGDFHIVGQQFAQEVTINGTRLDTFPRYPADKFNRIVAPCAQEAYGIYFFRKTGDFNQSLFYYYIDRDRRIKPLHAIVDEHKTAEAYSVMNQFFSGEQFVAKPMQSAQAINSGMEPDLSGWGWTTSGKSVAALLKKAETNQQIFALGNLRRLELDSVYSPLFKMRNRMLLFDLVSDTLYNFDPDIRDTRRIPLEFHRAGGWQKDLIVDAVAQRLYGRFSSHGNLILKEIDIEKGTVAHTYPLPLAPYHSSHFKIRNGFLWFLGQDDVNVPVKRLYKMNVFQ